MKKEELKKRESALAEAGYHKSHNTSSTNDYSWFKTVRDPADTEEWLYMIEWRVWCWLKYADRDPYCYERPYSMELCIIVNTEGTTRMINPNEMSIDQAETLAKDFYKFINDHINGTR